MAGRWHHRLRHVLWETPAWAFLLAGIAILAATLLVGPWLETRKLAWQRDLIRARTQRLEEEARTHQQMLAALEAQDPAVIQRLAFHYLRLKPVGARLLLDSGSLQPVGRSAPTLRLVAEPTVPIDAWLHRPMPVVGVDFPRYSPIDSLLVAVATGPMRLLVILLGGALVLLGLVPLGHLMRRPDARPGPALPGPGRTVDLATPARAATIEIKPASVPPPAAAPTLSIGPPPDVPAPAPAPPAAEPSRSTPRPA